MRGLDKPLRYETLLVVYRKPKPQFKTQHSTWKKKGQNCFCLPLQHLRFKISLGGFQFYARTVLTSSEFVWFPPILDHGSNLWFLPSFYGSLSLIIIGFCRVLRLRSYTYRAFHPRFSAWSRSYTIVLGFTKVSRFFNSLLSFASAVITNRC